MCNYAINPHGGAYYYVPSLRMHIQRCHRAWMAEQGIGFNALAFTDAMVVELCSVPAGEVEVGNQEGALEAIVDDVRTQQVGDRDRREVQSITGRTRAIRSRVWRLWESTSSLASYVQLRLEEGRLALSSLWHDGPHQGTAYPETALIVSARQPQDQTGNANLITRLWRGRTRAVTRGARRGTTDRSGFLLRWSFHGIFLSSLLFYLYGFYTSASAYYDAYNSVSVNQAQRLWDRNNCDEDAEFARASCEAIEAVARRVTKPFVVYGLPRALSELLDGLSWWSLSIAGLASLSWVMKQTIMR